MEVGRVVVVVFVPKKTRDNPCLESSRRRRWTRRCDRGGARDILRRRRSSCVCSLPVNDMLVPINERKKEKKHT